LLINIIKKKEKKYIKNWGDIKPDPVHNPNEQNQKLKNKNPKSGFNPKHL